MKDFCHGFLAGFWGVFAWGFWQIFGYKRFLAVLDFWHSLVYYIAHLVSFYRYATAKRS
jgi:hypothetical protein